MVSPLINSEEGVILEHKDEKLQVMDSFVDELPALRAKLGISQGEVAKRIGVSRQTVSAIESKRRKVTWNLFLSLFVFFISNETTYNMMKLKKGFVATVYKYLSVDVPIETPSVITTGQYSDEFDNK